MGRVEVSEVASLKGVEFGEAFDLQACSITIIINRLARWLDQQVSWPVHLGGSFTRLGLGYAPSIHSVMTVSAIQRTSVGRVSTPSPTAFRGTDSELKLYRMASARSSYRVNVSTFTTVTGPEAQRA